MSLIVQYSERNPTPEQPEGEGKAAKRAEKPGEKPVAKPGSESHE